MNPDGSLKWRFDIPEENRSFIVFDTKVGPDGNIYVAATHEEGDRLGVYSLTPDGTLRWNVPHPYDHGTTRRQIELIFGPGPQGTQLYFAANQNSYAISLEDGDVIFNNLPPLTGFKEVSPFDGTAHSAFYAYQPDGSIAWQSPVFLNGFPSIDSQGVHYNTTSLNSPKIIALNPAGDMMYEQILNLSQTSPEMTTVTPDDNLLLVHDIFNKLLALRANDGVEDWRIELAPVEGRPQYWLRRPAFDASASIAYYQSAVNTGGVIRDRMFVYAIAVTDAIPLLGDVNRDGLINLLDVGPFVEVLSSGTFQWEADINQDGNVNLLDAGPFVALLSGD